MSNEKFLRIIREIWESHYLSESQKRIVSDIIARHALLNFLESEGEK